MPIQQLAATVSRNKHLHRVQVTGTGGGTSIRDGERIYIAPSGVQKELMKPQDLFVMDYATREYLRRPPVGYHRTSGILEDEG